MKGSLTLWDNSLLYKAFSIIGLSGKNEQKMKFGGRGVGHLPKRSLNRFPPNRLARGDCRSLLRRFAFIDFKSIQVLMCLSTLRGKNLFKNFQNRTPRDILFTLATLPCCAIYQSFNRSRAKHIKGISSLPFGKVYYLFDQSTLPISTHMAECYVGGIFWTFYHLGSEVLKKGPKIKFSQYMTHFDPV